MNLLEDLIATLPDDAAVRSVLVGARWTIVCSRYCGLASTVTGDEPHGHAQVRDVGRLHLKNARELAEYARSDNPLEVSIGVAAINSLLDVDEQQAVEINAAKVIPPSIKAALDLLLMPRRSVTTLREEACVVRHSC